MGVPDLSRVLGRAASFVFVFGADLWVGAGFVDNLSAALKDAFGTGFDVRGVIQSMPIIFGF